MQHTRPQALCQQRLGRLLSLPCPEPLTLSGARGHDVHTWGACRATARPKTGDVTSRRFAPATRSPFGCSDSFSGRPPAKRSGLAVRPPHGTRHGGRRELVGGRKAGCGRPCARTARTPLTAATPHSPAQQGPRRDRKCVTDQSRPSRRVALPLGVPRPYSAVPLCPLGVESLLRVCRWGLTPADVTPGDLNRPPHPEKGCPGLWSW